MNNRTLALALGAPLCWGSTFTLAKPAVEHFPPILMMFFAYLFVAIVTVLTVRDRSRTPVLHLALMSLCCVTLQGALLFWAMRSVDATTANLVLQTQVPFAVLLSWLIVGDRLTSQKVLGTAVALLGVAIIIGLPSERPPVFPVLMIILSGAIWALGQTLVRKWSKDSGVVILKNNALFGVPQLLLATMLIEQGQWQSITSATPVQWLNLAFIVIFGFYLAYVLWFTLLKNMPVDEAAPYVLLMTPVGILTAVLFLGESLSRWQIIGGTVLMLGLAIVNGMGRKFAQQKTPA